MNIRTARSEDIQSLVKFNQEMALETEGKQLDREVLEKGVSAVFVDENKGFYVVAENEGKIVGGLMVTTEWSDWRNGWFWWIQSVYILPEARGRGVYRKLYEFVKGCAEENGHVCGFRLYVEKENETAQAVYEKLGMEKTYYLMYEEAASK
ncbi:GNAT family N-acetyltransferase [Leptolyngbya sp. 7M]|uniref:GNAT family N-acetyltransferase n=1 Tax=Leptolyngbya sp. 7M TaxID=2812896 RepID=UPI001B8C6717|nr:N-acetyltransferase [Leptolyngbya sp. 7M]QYO65870.1 GNAT family N-acetyltransferase [Leptolyngbya sp. 7M]